MHPGISWRDACCEAGWHLVRLEGLLPLQHDHVNQTLTYICHASEYALTQYAGDADQVPARKVYDVRLTKPRSRYRGHDLREPHYSGASRIASDLHRELEADGKDGERGGTDDRHDREQSPRVVCFN